MFVCVNHSSGSWGDPGPSTWNEYFSSKWYFWDDCTFQKSASIEIKTNSAAYVYSRWIVSNQNCLVGVSWWGSGRNYYWNSVGAKNGNGLGLSSIAMLSLGLGVEKQEKNTFSFWNCTTSSAYGTRWCCKMMSSFNTSCFFLSLFGPGEQLFLCFTRIDQIAIQEIRPSTIGATVLTSVSSPSRSGSGLSEHKESPFLTGGTWSNIGCVPFTKQKQYVEVCISIVTDTQP